MHACRLPGQKLVAVIKRKKVMGVMGVGVVATSAERASERVCFAGAAVTQAEEKEPKEFNFKLHPAHAGTLT